MLDILEKLIAARSVSPDDGGSIDYISSLLSGYGFKCHIKYFGEGQELTKNLYAEYGKTGQNLCFAGHVDVVPPGDLTLWKHDPFQMIEQNGVVYGRGAVDMKGAVAAMLTAAIEWSKHSDGRVSLLLTSDEEASGKFGTKMMLDWMKSNDKKIDFAIVGEPTSSEQMGDMIKLGRRGSINFKLIINGVQGHAAYPEIAKNPNHIIVKLLDSLINHKIDEGNDFFDNSSLQISSIDVCNPVSNVIPAKAEARFNIRYSNVKEAEEIIEEIKAIISDKADNFTLDYNISARSFLAAKTPFTERFKELVEKECRVKTKFSTTGGTSDARFIKDYCPLLEFGLLNKTAHHVNECTEIRHLQKLFTVYYKSVKLFHGTV